jgi:predicted RecA/RadA family phage recombinase
MATAFNIINEGQQTVDLENYTPSAALKKGDLVVIGGKPMLAAYAMKAEAQREAGFCFGGEYEFAIADVDTAAATTAAGTAVYITSAGALSLTATDNTLFGCVTRNKGETLWVKQY